MIRKRLIGLFDYVQFPASTMLFTVGAIDHLEKAVNATGFLARPLALSGNIFNHAALGAVMGVAIGNVFKQNHHKSNALFVMPAAAAGVVAGYAANETSALAPYAAAFAAATAGIYIRRNFILPENIQRGNDLDY